MDGVLLLIVAAILPWIVHIAPPRHRSLALVGAIAVVVMYWVFRSNPLGTWQLWAGILAGVASIVASSALAGRERGTAPRRRAFEIDHDGSQPTGEI